MIKRIFHIVTFPFYFIYLLISFPFKIVKIILDDKFEKRRSNDSKLSVKTNDKELIDIGALLFPEVKTYFETFFNTFLNDNKRFLTENEELLEDYDNLQLDKLTPIEVIYIFGDSKEKLWMTDWRGEENEREIENFLEDNLQIKTDWKNVNEIRKGFDEEKQSDGKFIIDLLKTIDRDLESINKRLIFLDLGWDAYVYTAIDQVSFETITDNFGTYFHGTEKLRK
ncbi:hypothetical protein ACFOUP_04510 [Belliella kenyensis]|uniref:DUF6630 domain-containing protein n=1 Tax=Belliella kenyensis TaxID=1472724 RepID=A0ABV8EHY0_9BACT|nr:hypothetical protein [Belliella kenyensis]MCH7403921.1 hypothetical protein [Belliella kenyensis]MDN3603022.1 hypothetical protein [Belliella kenyensis]